jgi:hypothetical protein
MPQQQTKVPKGGRNVERGARLKVRTQAMRPEHIKRSRERHIKNALQSCGKKFADELRSYYIRVGNPGKKHSH